MSPEILSQIHLKDVIYMAFFAGMLWAEFRVVKKSLDLLDKKLDKLEDKVEKHNSFDRRIVRLEALADMQGGANERKMD